MIENYRVDPFSFHIRPYHYTYISGNYIAYHTASPKGDSVLRSYDIDVSESFSLFSLYLFEIILVGVQSRK